MLAVTSAKRSSHRDTNPSCWTISHREHRTTFLLEFRFIRQMFATKKPSRRVSMKCSLTWSATRPRRCQSAGRFASPVEIPRLPSAPFSRIVGPHEDFRTHARSRCLRDASYTRGKNTRKEDCRIWSTFLLPGAREVVVPTASSFAFLSSAREQTRMAPWRV